MIHYIQLSRSQQLYESSQKQVSKLQELLVEVSGEKAVLEERFQILAENHEQMIRIKDEYKAENYRLSSKQCTESDIVQQLQKELEHTKSSRDGLEKKCQLLEHRVCEQESKMEAERADHQSKFEKISFSHSNEVGNLRRSLESEQVCPCE